MNTGELSTLGLIDIEIETARNTGRSSYIEAIMEIRQRVAALESERDNYRQQLDHISALADDWNKHANPSASPKEIYEIADAAEHRWRWECPACGTAQEYQDEIDELRGEIERLETHIRNNAENLKDCGYPNYAANLNAISSPVSPGDSDGAESGDREEIKA